MSNQAPSRYAKTKRQTARAGKKMNKREAAARRAAAQRRRRTMIGAVAGVAVVALLVLAFVLFGGSAKKKTPQASSSTCVSSSGSAAPYTSLPPSADPALGTMPIVTCGTGTVSALKTTTLIEGTGAAVKSGQTISVNYVGVTYATGQEFDASWSSGQPFSTVIGQGKVIPGWDQGLVGVKVGSRVQLDIPSKLAYGDSPTGGQPAGALRFVIDVLSAQ